LLPIHRSLLLHFFHAKLALSLADFWSVAQHFDHLAEAQLVATGN
jgi:hypothetical protein